MYSKVRSTDYCEGSCVFCAVMLFKYAEYKNKILNSK